MSVSAERQKGMLISMKFFKNARKEERRETLFCGERRRKEQGGDINETERCRERAAAAAVCNKRSIVP